MPKTKISEFSTTPANNTDIDSINIAEGCAPSGINDAIRELMAQLKDFQTGAVGDSFNGPVGTTTAAAGAFTTLSASGAVTLSGGTANGVAYLNGSKVVTSGSALTFDGTNFVNTAGFLGTTQSGATSSYFIAKNSVATSGVVFGAHSSGAGYIDVINNNPLFFAVNDTEAMRLTSTSLYTASGISVGIGTSTPTYKLQIKGSGAQGAVVTSTSGSASLILENFTGSGNYAYIQYNGHSGSGLQFYDTANVTARMTLDSSGNLGLGVSPSGWGSSSAISPVLVIKHNGNALWSPNANETILTNNAYYTGTSWTYNGSFQATQYSQLAGVHRWLNAPSGTAGDAITFTQAMTLSAGGNLGLGETSPVNLLSLKYSATDFGASILVNNTSAASGATPSMRFVNASSSAGLVIGKHASGFSDSNLAYINQETNAPLAFFTNNTERARIDSSGTFRVKGAGTAGSTDALQISGSAPASAMTLDSSGNLLVGTTSELGARFNSSSGTRAWAGWFQQVNNAGNSVVMTEYSTGAPNNTTDYFGLFRDTGGQRIQLRSNGGIGNFSANDVNLSDRREKTNFTPATSYLDKICAIPVQTFNYIDQNLEEDGGLTLGVVAQDVQAVAPELVMESNWAKEGDEPKMRLSIYQTDLQYALMKCIQEQQAIIESMRTEIDALKAKVGA
jgi:hypothetical protein